MPEITRTSFIPNCFAKNPDNTGIPIKTRGFESISLNAKDFFLFFFLILFHHLTHDFYKNSIILSLSVIY